MHCRCFDLIISHLSDSVWLLPVTCCSLMLVLMRSLCCKHHSLSSSPPIWRGVSLWPRQKRRRRGYKGYSVCLLVRYPGLAQHGEREAGAQPRREAHNVKMHSPDLILVWSQNTETSWIIFFSRVCVLMKCCHRKEVEAHAEKVTQRSSQGAPTHLITAAYLSWSIITSDIMLFIWTAAITVLPILMLWTFISTSTSAFSESVGSPRYVHVYSKFSTCNINMT